jgi:hypothetical protein
MNPQPPPPPGLSPNETLLFLLGEMRGQLASLVSMVQAADKSRAEMRDTIDQDIRDLRAETARLKRWVWTASGVAAAVLWVVSNLGPSVIAWLR